MIGNRITVIVAGGLIFGIFNWWLVVNKNVMLASFDGIIQKESIAYNSGKNDNSNHNNNNNNHTISDKKENDQHDDHQQSFEWNFIDFTKKPFCGSDKCLFQSSFNSQHDNEQQQVGYIVSKDSKHDSTLDDGWKISQYLVSKFGIKHFQLEAPQKVNISMNTTSAFLNYYLSVREDDVRTIQKVQIAQNGSQELRLHHSEEEIFSRLDEVVSAMSTNNSRSNNSINEDSTSINISSPLLLSFLEILSIEVETTFDLLQCEPLLALDFQVFVDIRGNMFHLDFDRVLTQFGGLRGYNQTAFDEKVWSRLTASTELLTTINNWVAIQRNQQHQEEVLKRNSPAIIRKKNYTVVSDTNNNNDDSRRHNNVFNCISDWEKEESMILHANNLSCLAIERVKIARQTTTTTISSSNDNNSGRNVRKEEKRLRHPLAVALLQRVIRNGFYSTDTTKFWDCNVYGDRVHG